VELVVKNSNSKVLVAAAESGGGCSRSFVVG